MLKKIRQKTKLLKTLRPSFTLVEVLVAMAILMMLIGAMVGIEVSNIKLADSGKHQLQATGLARGALNLVRTIRDTNILNSANLFDGFPDSTNPIKHLVDPILNKWGLANGEGVENLDGTDYHVQIKAEDISVNPYTITEYPVGIDPQSMTTGDFDGNGKPDIVTLNRGNNTVSIKMNDGTGNFTVKPDLITAVGPWAVATGDFDGDSKIDIAVTNYGMLPADSHNSISIFFGRGDGTFEIKKDYITQDYPNEIVAGDFNGDNKTDIAFSSITNSAGLGIMLGNANRNAISVTKLQIGLVMGIGMSHIATGDFNNPKDGKMDLVLTSGSDNNIFIAMNNGAGNFSFNGYKSAFIGGVLAGSITTGDFNRDSITDIAVNSSSQTSILLGIGGGNFGNYKSYNAVGDSQDIATGDINGDNITDLVIVSSDNRVYILIGTGNTTGDFTMPPIDIDFTGISYYALSVTTADFDGDGKEDIAVSSTAPTVTVLLNKQSTATSKRIQVIVSWNERGVEKQVDFYEILSDITP